MGVNDRDYMRERPRRSWWEGLGRYGITGWLIWLTALVYVLQLVVVDGSGRSLVTEGLRFSTDEMLRGQVWRMFSYAFTHTRASLFHLLFNMLLLWFVGRPVEQRLGSREFLAFYLLAAAAGALLYMAVDLATAWPSPGVVGASGAVMGLLALFAIWHPRQKVLLMFVFPVEVRWLVLAFFVFDLYPVLVMLGGGAPLDNIAHAAHLGGVLFGVAYWRFLQGRLHGWVGWAWPKQRRKPPKTVRQRSARVDELLDKISEKGIGSLTEAEREFLRRSSGKDRR